MAHVLNNDGVTALSQGDLVAATMMLRNSLDRVQAPEDPGPLPETVEVLPTVVPLPCSVIEAQRTFSPHVTHVMYPKAICLPLNRISESDAVMVVLYNLGLALHFRSYSMAKHKCLYKAKQMYQLAAVHYARLEDTPDSAIGPLVKMSTLANLASVHAHFGEVDAARACHQALQELLLGSSGIYGTVPLSEHQTFLYLLQVARPMNLPGAA